MLYQNHLAKKIFLGDVFHGLSTSISTSFRYQQILRAIFPQIDVYITHVINKGPPTSPHNKENCTKSMSAKHNSMAVFDFHIAPSK